jgi:hypothetical protein
MWNMGRILVLILSFAVHAGCSAPDPQPWMKDPAYLMLQTQLSETNTQLSIHQAELDEMKKSLDSAVVQTGQAKTARAKLEKQRVVVDRFSQKVRQLKLSLQTRRAQAQSEYMEAFHQGLDKAPSDSSDQWSLQLALSARSRAWKVERRMAEEKENLKMFHVEQ